MNKYDKRYDIRLATYDEIPKVMAFIDKYWKKGHIMSINRELFEYEYYDGNNVHMVIAIDRFTDEIEAIFGYISCSYTNKEKYDIWGSMWKVNETHDNLSLLGIELAKRVYTLSGCRYQIGNGANPNTTIPLRKLFFKEKTARMKQFYFG